MQDNNNKNLVSEIVEEINPSDISNLNNKSLISLLNEKKKSFFVDKNIEIVKLINNKVFQNLSKDCIKDLELVNVEILVKTEKIKYLPIFLLNEINKSIFKDISNNFYNQIQEIHIKNAKEKILKLFIELEKYNLLNGLVFECFCKKIKFSNLEEKHIFSILEELNKRNKFNYITGENFICLENYIDKEEIGPYLYKLKNVHYFDDKEIFFSSNKEPTLTKDDIKYDEQLVIKYEEIHYKIETFLNYDSYDLLKAYCIKCSRNVKNEEKMINILNSQLKYSKDNIYDLIEELEIRKILIILSKEKTIIRNNYIRIKQIIKDMQNIELSDPDEFLSKVNKFSEIIKEKSFNNDFLEILAEENYRYMKFVLNKFYNGSDKNAAPPELKKIHINIINDYMTILEKKYLIDKNKILGGLQKIEGENKNQQLTLFETSLNQEEKLYYDLLIETILEQPDSESYIESCATPIFKVLRNIFITFAGFKLSSLTGSKILTALSLTIGSGLILKDVKDEIIKNYFSLNEDERNIYHRSHKNFPKNRAYIIKKKLKTITRLFEPIKKKFNKFIDKKILHLKEVPNTGFEKLLSYQENIDIESENFRNNEIKIYYKKLKKIIKLKYKQILIKIKDKFSKNNVTNNSRGLNKFFDVKKKIINKIIEKKEKKLKEKYPEYKDPDTFEKAINIIKKCKSGGLGLIKSFSNVLTFGLTTNILAKKNNVDNILEIAKNIKYNKFQEELKEIEKDREKANFHILVDDIKYLCKLSREDENLFIQMKKNKNKEIKEIIEEKIHFQPALLEEDDKIKELINNNNLNNDYDMNSDISINLLDESEYNDEECLIKT